MAVFKPGPYPPGRQPSFRGVLMQDAVRGQLRVRVWPGPAKKRKTQQQKDLEYAFREANKTAKQWPPDQQVDYREAVAGTALLPRDLILMTIYGNALAIKMQDGKVLYSMVSRAKVSESLDILSQQPGSILARGETYWAEIPAGDEGQILVMGPDGLPSWATIASPGGPVFSEVLTYQEKQANAYQDLATVGPQITLETGESVLINISAMATRVDNAPGCNGYLGVAVSGASTFAADDYHAATASATFVGHTVDLGTQFVYSGLTPGVNTFTMKYKENCGRWGYYWRRMTVTPL